MAPDLNSLPPSRSPSLSSSAVPRTMSSSAEISSPLRNLTPSPTSRTASISLQAAAAVNAGLQHEEPRRPSNSSNGRVRSTPQTGRRRSAVMMNLQLNDPALPAPGEMISESSHSSYQNASPSLLNGSPIVGTGDPHHSRAPSLGEIHQELEQEQEAQVNRLLQMIRAQQQQLNALQATSGSPLQTGAAVDESTPTSERSLSFSNPTITGTPAVPITTPRSPHVTAHPRSSFDIASRDLNRRSRTPSRTASPRVRATSITNEGGEGFSLGGRDESAFYQAETQMMVRENQMLRMRIRELERQVSELHANASITHEPATSSHLSRAQSVSEETQSTVPGTFPEETKHE